MALLIDVTKPVVLKSYRTRDRTKLRVGDSQSLGQVALCFAGDEEAKSFLAALLGELEAPLPTI